MDIYESLNYISKQAFPKIKFTWEKWSINEETPIFKISIFSNAIEDYIIGNYEKGLKSIIKVIENNSLSREVECYAKQLLVVLADQAINYHSDVCKNKPQIACKLFKKYDVFRENVIKYAPYLPRLLSNLVARSFFDLDFKTVKDVCENCIPQYIVGTELHQNLIKKLYDEFTYNHSFEKLVTKDNALKYWKIAEYIDCKIPELNFFEVNDGKYIYTVKKDIDSINALNSTIGLVKKGTFWIDQKNLPKHLEFSFKYPNGINGDLLRYIFEEFGEITENTSSFLRGRIPQKHIKQFEIFSTIPYYLTDEQCFFDIFEKHHLPTILYRKRHSVAETNLYKKIFYEKLMVVLNAHKKEQEKQRKDLYSRLILLDRTSPKWKTEALLFSLVSGFYPDAIYQYRPDWLDMQSLDIYIPSLYAGIEYQGVQHYKAIEHFGGEEHFLQQQENDRKKKQLCKDNGVILIEWPYSKEVTEEEVRKVLNINADVIPQKGNVSYINPNNKKRDKAPKGIANDIKLELINKHLKQHISIKKLSDEYGANESDIKQWIHDYLFYGEAKFTSPKAKRKSNNINKKSTPKIPKEMKIEIINKYLSGSATQKELAKQYNVSASSIGIWVSGYQKYGDKIFDK